jgi:hypothetical protein
VTKLRGRGNGWRRYLRSLISPQCGFAARVDITQEHEPGPAYATGFAIRRVLHELNQMRCKIDS